jgi:long-chain acyl-CoA synthetase
MVKRVRVVSDEWTVDSGELTPSLKLKRRVIVEKYKETIREIYGESA